MKMRPRRSVVLHIIEDYFGPVVKDVAAAVLDIDQSSLLAISRSLALSSTKFDPALSLSGSEDIVRNRKITPTMTRACLAILMKHGLLNVTSLVPDESEEISPSAANTKTSDAITSPCLYSINLDAVLNFLHHGRLIAFISSNTELGPIGAHIVEEVLANGSATIQSIRATCSDLKTEDFEMAFQKLVQMRLLRPSLSLLSTLRLASSSKNGGSSALNFGIVENNGRGQSSGRGISGRSSAAAAGRGGRGRGRGRGKPDTKHSEGGLYEPETSSGTFMDSSGSISKRSRSHFEEEENGQFSNLFNPAIRWAVNMDSFLRIEKCKLLSQFVSDQFDEFSGQICMTALSAVSSNEKPNALRSESFTALDTFNKLQEKQGTGQNNSSKSTKLQAHSSIASSSSNKGVLTEVAVKRALDSISMTSTSPLEKVDNSIYPESLYKFNYQSVLTQLRNRTIYRIVSARHGLYAARAFELLSRNRYLEQQQLSDKLILPARDTRELLYGLYLNGWVSYQELSKRGDFNASSSFYFWFVDPARTRATILSQLYHGLHNLLLRLESEKRQAKKLKHSLSLLPSEEEQKDAHQAQLRIQLLHYSASELFKTTLLFERF